MGLHDNVLSRNACLLEREMLALPTPDGSVDFEEHAISGCKEAADAEQTTKDALLRWICLQGSHFLQRRQYPSAWAF